MKKHYKNEYGFSATILIIIGVLLTVAAGTGGYFLSRKLNAPRQIDQQQATQQEKTAPLAPMTDTSQKSISEITSLPENQNATDQILWNSPQEITSLKILNDEEGSKYYKVGTFTDGKYKNGELILLSAPLEGPVFYPEFYRFARQNSKLILLEKYSSNLYDVGGLIRSKFSIDENYAIPALEFPKSFNGPKSRQVLELQSEINAFFSLNNLKKSFADNKLGDVYTSKNFAPNDIFGRNGFYIKSPDGTVKVYSLIVDFVGKDNVPAITWNDGSQNKTEYTFTDMGGCGSQNYISVFSGINFDDLESIGKNSKNDAIYKLKDSNHSLLRHNYNDVYTVFNGQKVSYEEFLSNYPVFFWKDPFDRWIKFQNNKFMSAAECGKPVIYLYPEKPEKVSVKVEPVGGMSYSDPLYGNGWIVNADTNSNLIEIKSGKTYPYLFWEGRGGIYEQPQKGFVVERKNIHNFLIEKLAKLGLNKKETADFMEFWEPRMQNSPYYFVTFLGNQAMDQLAPLTIDPKPDTIIRILMDFMPLEKPIEIEGYEIKTPERKGFTVVEWGGVLR